MQLRDAIGNQGRLPGAACGSECSIGGCHCHHCDAAVANRTASATDRPCAARTSTCRNLATISSGLCLFLAIRILLRLQKPYFREDHFSGGRPLSQNKFLLTVSIPSRQQSLSYCQRRFMIEL